MRIDALNKVSQLYNSSSVKNTSASKSSSFNDMLEISQTGKDYHVAKQILANTPDVREDKIKDIKQRMDAGNYEINSDEYAEKLVNRYFNELA